MYLLFTTIQAVTFVPFLNMFVALGEEVGWRGAMYPYLKEKLGVTKGRIVGGTIWVPSPMHGAINAFTVFAYLTKPEYADKAILGPAYIGIISMIPMIIMAVILCVSKGKAMKQ